MIRLAEGQTSGRWMVIILCVFSQEICDAYGQSDLREYRIVTVKDGLNHFSYNGMYNNRRSG